MSYSPPTFESESLNKIARSTQAAWAALVLAIGLIVGLAFSLGASVPAGLTKLLMASTLIFGTVEVPRLRGVPEFVQLLAMTFTAVIAALFAAEFGNADMQLSAMVAIVMLFIGSLIVLGINASDARSEDEVVE